MFILQQVASESWPEQFGAGACLAMVNALADSTKSWKAATKLESQVSCLSDVYIYIYTHIDPYNIVFLCICVYVSIHIHVNRHIYKHTYIFAYDIHPDLALTTTQHPAQGFPVRGKLHSTMLDQERGQPTLSTLDGADDYIPARRQLLRHTALPNLFAQVWTARP